MKSFFYALVAALPMVFVSCGDDDSPAMLEDIDVVVSTSLSEVYNGDEVTFSATATGGDTRVATFYLDGRSIGSTLMQPYSMKYKIKDLAPGSHTVTCIVASMKGNDFVGDTAITLTLRLGDEYLGGKIFLLNADGKSGLIAAKEDMFFWQYLLVSQFKWSQSGQGAIGTSMTDGKSNTAKMVEVTPASFAPNFIPEQYAAWHFINGYTYNDFSDWYIPSLSELEILREHRELIGNFETVHNINAYYWSSSEVPGSNTNAHAIHFTQPAENVLPKTREARIRPIRQF